MGVRSPGLSPTRAGLKIYPQPLPDTGRQRRNQELVAELLLLSSHPVRHLALATAELRNANVAKLGVFCEDHRATHLGGLGQLGGV